MLRAKRDRQRKPFKGSKGIEGMTEVLGHGCWVRQEPNALAFQGFLEVRFFEEAVYTKLHDGV